MDEASRDKLLAKLRKLLAKADVSKNNSVEEAAAAAALAAKLMAQYNIDQAEVIREELRSHEHVIWQDVYANVNPGVASVVPRFAQEIGVTIAQLFDCEANLVINPSWGRCIRIYGYRTDVEVAAWTFNYLMNCIRNASKAYRRELTRQGITAHDQKRYSISFRQGMAARIASLLGERLAAKQAADNEAMQDQSSTALVVVKQDAIREKFGDFRYKTSSIKVADATSYQYGIAEAEKINLTPNAIRSNAA